MNFQATEKIFSSAIVILNIFKCKQKKYNWFYILFYDILYYK